MIKRNILLFILMVFFQQVFLSDSNAIQVQLPFVDGDAFECTQNSYDFPTHLAGALYTQYDLDFSLPKGTLLTAAIDGTVHIGTSSSFGNYVKIDSGICGSVSGKVLYAFTAHMMDNGTIVREGQEVKAGQPIGFSGNTGSWTGKDPNGDYHVHFGVHEGDREGTSVKMSVKAREYKGATYEDEGFFDTGDLDERDMYCQNEGGAGNRGNFYEAIPKKGIFNEFQCHQLDDDQGILCWHGDDGHLAFCEEGLDHVRYYYSNGRYRSESVFASNNLTYFESMCNPTNANNINLFAYLDGNNVGGDSDNLSDPGTPDPTPDVDVHIDKVTASYQGDSNYDHVTNIYLGQEVKMEVDIENKGDEDIHVDIDYYWDDDKSFSFDSSHKVGEDNDVKIEHGTRDNGQPENIIEHKQYITFSAVGTYYLYVKVTTNGDSDESASSNTREYAKVIVSEFLEEPVPVTQPTGKNWNELTSGEKAAVLQIILD